MPDPVSDLLALEGFRTGLLLGLVAALGIALVAVVSRQSRPWAGGAFALAGVAALDDLYRVDTLAIAGLVLIIAGGHLAAGRGPLLQIAGAVPGTAVFVTALDLDRPAWAVPMIVGVTLVGGALAALIYDQLFLRRDPTPEEHQAADGIDMYRRSSLPEMTYAMVTQAPGFTVGAQEEVEVAVAQPE